MDNIDRTFISIMFVLLVFASVGNGFHLSRVSKQIEQQCSSK